MDRLKCKKSVFCGYFLVCFLLGTICGVFLFRVLDLSGADWIGLYGAELVADSVSVGAALRFLFFLRPVFLALCLIMIPYGFRALPVLIVGRACVIAYSIAFLFAGNMPVSAVAVRNAFLLPVF